MPSFLIGPYKNESVKVRRTQVFFRCEYRLPEEVKEKMAIEDSFPLEANLIMGFYCDPVPGDVIEWSGHLWGIKYRKHYPTKRNSKDKKVIAELILEYLGKSE